MCKIEPLCHRGYLVGLRFREISMKRQEQNNRRAYAALKRHDQFVVFYFYCKIMLISISYNYCSVLIL